MNIIFEAKNQSVQHLYDDNSEKDYNFHYPDHIVVLSATNVVHATRLFYELHPEVMVFTVYRL